MLDPHSQGHAAYLAARPLSACPYARSDHASEWKNGWMHAEEDALKRRKKIADKTERAKELTAETGVQVVYDQANDEYSVCTPKGFKHIECRRLEPAKAAAQLVAEVTRLRDNERSTSS